MWGQLRIVGSEIDVKDKTLQNVLAEYPGAVACMGACCQGQIS